MKTTLSCLAAVAACIGLAPAAHAQDADLTVRTVMVPYEDLNVSAEADARILLARIAAAGTKACRRDGEQGLSGEASRCRKAAVTQAVHDVRSPTLTALYEGDAIATVLASR